MDDSEFAATFVPDHDDYFDDVDPDAYMAMEAEQEEFEQQHALNTAGQSGPRKLDFAAYGDLSGAFSNPLEPSGAAAASASGTAPISSQLNLRLTGSQLAQPAAAAAASSSSAPKGLSNFDRERQAEEQRRNSSNGGLQHTASSLFPSASVLPPLHRSVSELRQRVLDDDRMYVYRRAPVLGEFMPVTTASGQRVFLTMNTEEEAAKKLAAHSHLHRTQQMHRDLGQMNVRKMIRQLDEESTAAALQASLAHVKAHEWDSDPEDDEKTRLRKRRQRRDRLKAKLDAADQALVVARKNKRLWVDKYTPKGYADLLSPEHINREVLEWLKAWDTCVFGAKKTPAADAANAPRTLDNHMLSSAMLAPAARKSKKPIQVISADGETDIRPEHKVILLCGPPGLGKTTLAHILARQAGYHPYEINASDDRNPAVLEAKIRAATEMQTVSFGASHDARPNCVILDEIDGVAGETAGQQGAIAMLLRIIQAEPKPAKGAKRKGAADDDDDQQQGGEDDSDDEGEDAGASDEIAPRKSKAASAAAAKKAARPGPLKRPIICICNDQFAAALRPLRNVARIFEFVAAPKTKFVDRLKHVARSEGMDVDARTLGALADIVDCDIRSALNTLQFVHTKGEKLTAASLNSLAVGRKDVEKSRFQIWDAVFCDRETKKDNLLHFKNARETENANNKMVSSVVNAKEQKNRELHGLLQDSGDFDKVLEGIFHNYPSVGYPDPSLGKTVECAEWLAYADLLEQRIQSELEMSLNQYTPYAALGIHLLTARPRKVKMEAPSMFYFQYMESQRNLSIVRSFLSPSNCFTLEGATVTSTVLDVLPHVLDILHPTIRAVNFALLTSREKNELHNLIDTMLGLAITYRPEIQSSFASSSSTTPAWKQGGGEVSNVLYKLEPAIDLLSVWSDPLDATTTKKFEAKDKFGNAFPNKTTFGQKFGQQPMPSFKKIDKRDVNMPNKVKREVLRELEFESMRRAEAARSVRFSEDAQAALTAGSGSTQDGSSSATSTAAATPAVVAPVEKPSFLSPAVQRMLDEEKRKRERPAAAAAAAASSFSTAASSPPTGASKLPLLDDVSPATKRAKHSATLNFLNQHADAARNSKARQRGRATPAAKLELAGLKTERESKMSEAGQLAANSTAASSASAASVMTDVPGSMGPPAALPARAIHPLHFKYNEGCTNAVRRTVHVAHFLPL